MDKQKLIQELVQEGYFLFYQNENVKAELILGKETIWATKKEIAKIFNTNSKNINSHIQNIFKESKFEEFLTLRVFLKSQSATICQFQAYKNIIILMRYYQPVIQPI